VPKLAFSASLAVFPHAFIPGTIGPLLNTVPVLVVSSPLALIDCSILENNFFSRLKLGIASLVHVSEQLSQFMNSALLWMILIEVLLSLVRFALTENFFARKMSTEPGLKQDYFWKSLSVVG